MEKKIKVGIIRAGSRAKFQTTAVKESNAGNHQSYFLHSPMKQKVFQKNMV
ncbi:MAG: hypothetical protein NC931_05005 [Candidatus Omnitrophica bacterium]|nr:hypothetical protein [Candidatus Omnitrophota bacterium]